MKALVLSAGLGMRMRPITDTVPKPIMEIAGIILLEDLLRHLAAQGVKTAVVNGFWHGKILEDRLAGMNLPLEVLYRAEERLTGTAGAVRDALPLLGERFLVVNGCNLTRQPVAPLLEILERTGADLVMTVAPTGEPSRKNIVETDPKGRITGYRANPPDELSNSNLCDSGMYLCSASISDVLENAGTADFGPGFFRRAAEKGFSVYAETVGGYHLALETLSDYLVACHDVLSGTVLPYRPNPRVTRGALFEENPPVDVEVTGTFWLRKGSKIGEGCSFENCVLLGDSSVGCGCRLKNSLVLPGSSVPDGTVRDDKYLKIF